MRPIVHNSGALFLGVLVLVAFCGFTPLARAIGQDSYIENHRGVGDFALVEERSAAPGASQTVAPIYVDPGDFAGVLRAAEALQADIQRVTGQRPTLLRTSGQLPAHII